LQTGDFSPRSFLARVVRRFSQTGRLEIFTAYQTGDFSPSVRLVIFLRTVS